MPADSSSFPPADQIRQTVAEVLTHPDYSLEDSAEENEALARYIADLLEPILDPIGDAFGGLMAASPVLGYLTLAVLTVTLVTVVVHIIYSLVTATRGRQLARLNLPSAEDHAPRSADDWEDASRRHADQGDYTEAGRCLLRASLMRLAQTLRRPPRPGATNREYLRRFARTEAHAPLLAIIRAVDWRWYAGARCDADDYATVCESYRSILSWLGRREAS